MLHFIDRFPQHDPEKEAHLAKSLGEEPLIAPSARIFKSQVGSWTDIGPNSLIVESIFDDYSYTAGDVDMIYTELGKFASIASHVRINPGNHPMERVTQHHMTYRRKQFGMGETDDEAFFDWRRAHKCVIGHDTWIGHGVTIMPGVQIGTGAVVGSGAVVTKNVQPYEIVVGVPAKPIRMRFPEAVAERLLAIAWWDWDRAKLEAAFEDLNNVNLFIEKYG